MDVNNIWNSFLEKVKDRVSAVHYEIWFMETELISLDEEKAKVKVPSHVYKKHLKETYNEFITEVFTEVTGTNFQFEYLTEDELENKVEEEQLIEIGVPTQNDAFESNLNNKYFFENYVGGESNKFAKATALAVAEKPGYMYNPLFMYGKSGLGKTHLMHAIGNYIVKNSNKKVLYVTSEQFVRDFIELSRKSKYENNIDSVEKFKKKYRDVDVLMIDDIQYLEIADKTQQEFFNTFNDLHTKNKQIVISSDRSPDDLKKLEDRLTTRFNWGLALSIYPPNFELRMNIIDKKIEGHVLSGSFPHEVKEFIANNCDSDIRKLEGAITRVFAYATMMSGADISIELARDALKDYFGSGLDTKNNIARVQQVVAKHYGITVEDLKSKKRVKTVSVPRQVAMYICRTVYEESLPKIGMEFGGKDHTTVIHSVEKIKKEINVNQQMENEITKLVNKVK